MLFTFLLIIQTLIAAAMVTVILMQRSEGGGLGVGGSPSGLMSARGAADFLTRATAILATLFVVLSIILAGLATVQQAPTEIDPSLSAQPPAKGDPFAPADKGPPVADPLADVARKMGDQTAPATPAPKAPVTPSNGAVPIAR